MAESTPNNKPGILAKAQKRLARTKTKVLQNLGKAEKTTDDIVNDYVTKVDKQQETGAALQKELKHYVHCVRNLCQANKSLQACLSQTYEDDWTDEPVFKEQIKAFDLLLTDYAQNMQESISSLQVYLQSFPTLKTKVAKRGRKMVDFDNSRHHMEVMQGAKKKDDAKIQKAQEDLNEAKRIYEQLNSELHAELPEFYHSRVSFYASLFTSLFGSEFLFHSETGKIYGTLGDVSQKLAKDYEQFVYQPKIPLNTSFSTNSTGENGLNGDTSSDPSTPVASGTSRDSSEPVYHNQAILDAAQQNRTPSRKESHERPSPPFRSDQTLGTKATMGARTADSKISMTSVTSSASNYSTNEHTKASLLSSLKRKLSLKSKSSATSLHSVASNASGTESYTISSPTFVSPPKSRPCPEAPMVSTIYEEEQDVSHGWPTKEQEGRSPPDHLLGENKENEKGRSPGFRKLLRNDEERLCDKGGTAPVQEGKKKMSASPKIPFDSSLDIYHARFFTGSYSPSTLCKMKNDEAKKQPPPIPPPHMPPPPLPSQHCPLKGPDQPPPLPPRLFPELSQNAPKLPDNLPKSSQEAPNASPKIIRRVFEISKFTPQIPKTCPDIVKSSPTTPPKIEDLQKLPQEIPKVSGEFQNMTCQPSKQDKTNLPEDIIKATQELSTFSLEIPKHMQDLSEFQTESRKLPQEISKLPPDIPKLPQKLQRLPQDSPSKLPENLSSNSPLKLPHFQNKELPQKLQELPQAFPKSLKESPKELPKELPKAPSEPKCPVGKDITTKIPPGKVEGTISGQEEDNQLLNSEERDIPLSQKISSDNTLAINLQLLPDVRRTIGPDVSSSKKAKKCLLEEMSTNAKKEDNVEMQTFDSSGHQIAQPNMQLYYQTAFISQSSLQDTSDQDSSTSDNCTQSHGEMPSILAEKEEANSTDQASLRDLLVKHLKKKHKLYPNDGHEPDMNLAASTRGTNLTNKICFRDTDTLNHQEGAPLGDSKIKRSTVKEGKRLDTLRSMFQEKVKSEGSKGFMEKEDICHKFVYKSVPKANSGGIQETKNVNDEATDKEPHSSSVNVLDVSSVPPSQSVQPSLQMQSSGKQSPGLEIQSSEKQSPGLEIQSSEKQSPGLEIQSSEKQSPGLEIQSLEKQSPGLEKQSSEKKSPFQMQSLEKQSSVQIRSENQSPSLQMQSSEKQSPILQRECLERKILCTGIKPETVALATSKQSSTHQCQPGEERPGLALHCALCPSVNLVPSTLADAHNGHSLEARDANGISSLHSRDSQEARLTRTEERDKAITSSQERKVCQRKVEDVNDVSSQEAETSNSVQVGRMEDEVKSLETHPLSPHTISDSKREDETQRDSDNDDKDSGPSEEAYGAFPPPTILHEKCWCLGSLVDAFIAPGSLNRLASQTKILMDKCVPGLNSLALPLVAQRSDRSLDPEGTSVDSIGEDTNSGTSIKETSMFSGRFREDVSLNTLTQDKGLGQSGSDPAGSASISRMEWETQRRSVLQPVTDLPRTDDFPSDGTGLSYKSDPPGPTREAYFEQDTESGEALEESQVKISSGASSSPRVSNDTGNSESSRGKSTAILNEGATSSREAISKNFQNVMSDIVVVGSNSLKKPGQCSNTSSKKGTHNTEAFNNTYQNILTDVVSEGSTCLNKMDKENHMFQQDTNPPLWSKATSGIEAMNQFRNVMSDIASMGSDGLKKKIDKDVPVPLWKVGRPQASLHGNIARPPPPPPPPPSFAGKSASFGDETAEPGGDSNFHLHDAMLSRLQSSMPLMKGVAADNKEQRALSLSACKAGKWSEHSLERFGSWDSTLTLSCADSCEFLDAEDCRPGRASEEMAVKVEGQGHKDSAGKTLQQSLALRRSLLMAELEDEDDEDNNDDDDDDSSTEENNTCRHAKRESGGSQVNGEAKAEKVASETPKDSPAVSRQAESREENVAKAETEDNDMEDEGNVYEDPKDPIPSPTPANDSSKVVNNDEDDDMDNLYSGAPSNKPIYNAPPEAIYTVEATHKYAGEDEDELSFEAGEIIHVIEFDIPDEQDDGWQLGMKQSDGKKGVFPENFTRRVLE